jgi:hypothetical protein
VIPLSSGYSGFVEPAGGPRPSASAQYLRAAGGAPMRLDYAGEGRLMWVCGGCLGESWYGWPLWSAASSRHDDEAGAWAAARDQALAHAHQCIEPSQLTAGEPAPRVQVLVERGLPVVYQPLVEHVDYLAEDQAELVREYTSTTEMPRVRIVVTTWWQFLRRRLGETMAVAGRPGRRAPWRVWAPFLADALRLSRDLATTIPDHAGGVTILINAPALAHSRLSIRELLLHELRHAAQLAVPWYRAVFVDLMRHQARVQLRDAQFLAYVDVLLERSEAEAEAAEEWSWQALNAEREREAAVLQGELDELTASDREQAARGRMRVACKWCDFEYYVDQAEAGPHSCHLCRHKDGY